MHKTLCWVEAVTSVCTSLFLLETFINIKCKLKCKLSSIPSFTWCSKVIKRWVHQGFFDSEKRCTPEYLFLEFSIFKFLISIRLFCSSVKIIKTMSVKPRTLSLSQSTIIWSDFRAGFFFCPYLWKCEITKQLKFMIYTFVSLLLH